MKFMCDNDEKTYEYLLNWIAHIFCTPAKKCGTAVMIKSNEQGVGKNRITDFIKYLMDGFARADEDSGYVMETEEFQDEVMGKFNSKMLNKFLVVIDEPNKTECFAKAEQFKRVITGNTFQCEKKGVDTTTKRSYHRFAILSNEGIPIKVDVSDRRYCIIECNGKPFSKQYYDALSADMEDVTVQKAFYLQLLSRKNIVSKFDWIRNIPDTDFRRTLKEVCVKPESLFFEDYMRDVIYGDPECVEHRVSTNVLFSLFSTSPHKPVGYSPALVTFTVALKNSFKHDWFSYKDARVDGRVCKAVIVDVQGFLGKYPQHASEIESGAGPSEPPLMMNTPAPKVARRSQK
jgi:hypothetical protein